MADGTITPRAQAARDRVPSDSTPTMNKRKLAKAATRQKVLDAGRALFAAVGYEKATIRDIAARAGMSTGAVFANFEDKQALYVAVYGHPPLTPEAGRDLAAVAKAIWEVRPENWDDGEDPEAGRAWLSLRNVLFSYRLAS